MTKDEFRKARKDLKLSQEAFARALGLSRISIARMEAGKQPISLTVELALKEVKRAARKK